MTNLIDHLHRRRLECLRKAKRAKRYEDARCRQPYSRHFTLGCLEVWQGFARSSPSFTLTSV
jgi:hypothetical protein